MRLTIFAVAVAVVIGTGCGHPAARPAPALIHNVADDTAPPVAPVAAAPSASCVDALGRSGPEYADQLYCQQVGDACCGQNGQVWVCNNARYLDWYAQTCTGTSNAALRPRRRVP
jgi:hypothetical protein